MKRAVGRAVEQLLTSVPLPECQNLESSDETDWQEIPKKAQLFTTRHEVTKLPDPKGGGGQRWAAQSYPGLALIDLIPG